MQTIVVKGKSNCGKTTALVIVIEYLLEIGFTVSQTLSTGRGGRDKVVVLVKGKITIVICTYGDPGKEKLIAKVLHVSVEVKCTLLLCASRTKGRIWEMLSQNASTNICEVITPDSTGFINKDEVLEKVSKFL